MLKTTGEANATHAQSDHDHRIHKVWLNGVTERGNMLSANISARFHETRADLAKDEHQRTLRPSLSTSTAKGILPSIFDNAKALEGNTG